MSHAQVIDVRTPSRRYQVHVGERLIGELGRLTRAVCPKAAKAQVISDSNVAPLYANEVVSVLADAGLSCTVQTFEAGEASKNIHTLSSLLEGLASDGLTRDDIVVALGGGVVGDIAGLAAAMYLRGCAVVQLPTSLLAMVDSSVGGKCAVDLKAGKNLAGAFWQPSLVVADLSLLDSLSHELFADSCGEIIKYGVIADAALFLELEADPIAAKDVGKERLVRIVARSIEIKRSVVEADEREGGLRQILNFGHTLGHAIEAASDFKLGHGSSISAGMCIIARASARMGWCSEVTARRIEDVVCAHGLPTDTDIDAETLLSFATHDKKRRADHLNVVVPREIGRVELGNITIEGLREIIDLGCESR